jgi:hypothetical protein
MWRARTTETDFSFSIPFTAVKEGVETIQDNSFIPSSYWHHRFGGVRYILTGIVYFKNGTKTRPPLAIHHELLYSENPGIVLSPNWFTQPKSLNSSFMDIPGGLFNFGKKGVIKLGVYPCTPETSSNSDSGIWMAGTVGYIHVFVDNGTQKEVRFLLVEYTDGGSFVDAH